MLKISVQIVLFTLLVYSCKQDNPEVVNANPVGERQSIEVPSGKKSEELQANAVPAGDIKGIATRALQSLQTVYKNAAGKVTGVGEVTVMVDDNLNLIIENKYEGSTSTQLVNLGRIDTDMSHVEIIPDKDGNKFPGFKVKTKSGKVDILKDGAKQKEQDYLEIYLAERKDVNKALTSIMFAAQAAQQTLPSEGAVNQPVGEVKKH
jgi:hypothetical protein